MFQRCPRFVAWICLCKIEARRKLKKIRNQNSRRQSTTMASETDPSVESPPVECYIPNDARHLDLGYVGDDGAVALAEELTSNTLLKVLNLAGARIGDDGAIAIAGALAIRH
jgi:Leucine Rich repeat